MPGERSKGAICCLLRLPVVSRCCLMGPLLPAAAHRRTGCPRHLVPIPIAITATHAPSSNRCCLNIRPSHTRHSPNPAAHTAHLPVGGQHHLDAGGQHGAQHAVGQHIGSILEVGDVGDAGANGGSHAAALRGGDGGAGAGVQSGGCQLGQQAWLMPGRKAIHALERRAVLSRLSAPLPPACPAACLPSRPLT